MALPSSLLSADRPERSVVLIIIVSAVCRLLLAVTIGLGIDESYTVAVSNPLSLSYFDHPPLTFWITGLLARGTGTEDRMLLRLPFVLLFAGTTWMVFRLGARLFSARAGMYAALLLNLSPVFSLSTGGWILPDGPLMFFEAASALCLSHILLPGISGRSSDGGEHGARSWLVVGLLVGGAALSKYHAIFVVLGALLFLITVPAQRRWLARWEPYAAGLAALVVFLPVLAWNSAHGWVSFRFQMARGAPHGAGLHVVSLLQSVAGQAGYILPWIWLPLVWGFVRALRAGPRDPARWLLSCLAIGPIVVFTALSLGGSAGLPHWPAPGYLVLFPLVGEAVARRETGGDRRAHPWIVGSAAAFVGLITLAATQTATGWVSRLAPSFFGRGDPSLEALDWRELPRELEQRGLGVRPGTFVAATHWIHAGKIGYALGPSVPVLCLCGDPRHFYYLHDERRFVGRDAILIDRLDKGQTAADVALAYAPYFAFIELAGTVPIRRWGHVELELTVFRARRLRRPFPAPLPP